MSDKTKVIRVFETFAGIGAQHKAIKNIQKNFKVVGTSEWDARAIIAYSQIHHKKEFEKQLAEVRSWEEKKVNEYLSNKTFSLNSKTIGNVIAKELKFKQNLVAANIVNNNFPNIKEVDGNILKNVDLLTYSFPCQGLSIANMGRDKGIDENFESTSNLIWEIKRILLDAKNKTIRLPKFLLMENVKNLLSKKHIDNYKKWLSFLESIGYKTVTTVLNGLNHGSLQKRERVFAVSVLNPEWKLDNNSFTEIMKKKFSNNLPEAERKKMYMKILNSSNIKEMEIAIPNWTSSRIKMAIENNDLFDRTWTKGNEWTFNTLTTKQDRHPNIGMIKIQPPLAEKYKMSKRFITPREAYQIMGFDNKDYDTVHEKFIEGIITKEALYRQAGNSIVVPVLENIFSFISTMEIGESN